MNTTRRDFLRAGSAAVALAPGLSVAKPKERSSWPKRPDRPYAGKVLGAGRPMPGVIVSNGRESVRTAADGSYELPYHADTRFVTVTVPSGWRCEWPYYSGQARKGSTDFRLVPWTASAGKGCAFIQIADSEIGSEAQGGAWVERVRRLGEENGCAFIVHTGDICYRRGLVAHQRLMNAGTMGRPVVYCVGNHDLLDGECGEQVFEALYGPCWHSFEAGGIHFCVTPMHGGDYWTKYTEDDVADWLRGDLALVPKTMPVVLFNHNLCNEADEGKAGVVYGDERPIDLRKACNFRGFIYGHRHDTYLRRRDGAVIAVSATPQHGGSNHSAETIKVFHVDESGGITSDNHHHDDWTWKSERAGAVWEAKLPGEVLYGTPVIAEGRVFVAMADDEGKGAQAVHALDAATGREIWRSATVNSVRNRMVLSRGKLIAQDAEGHVYALDPSDGREIWRHRLRYSSRSIASAPALSPDGRSVIVGEGTRMASLDVDTGRPNWEDGHFPEVKTSPIAPAVAEGRIVWAENWQGCFCNDLATGRLLWSVKGVPTRFPGPDPVIRDGKVIVACMSNVVEYDLGTGREIRNVKGACDFVMPSARPLLQDGLFIVGSSRSGLVALDEKTYEVRWKGAVGPALVGLSAYRAAGEKDVNTEAVSLGDGRIAATAVDGAIHIWSAADGRHLREIRTGVPYLAPLAVDEGFAYAADLHGFIRKFKV